MMTTHRWNVVAWFGLAAAWFVSVIGVAGAADVPAATTVYTRSYTAGIADSFTYGWTFQANSDVVVTQLGLWDYFSNGLFHSHPVGLWSSSQQLLASATVPAGTDGTLVNDFRYAPITPLTLSAGQSYYLGALYTPTEMDWFYLGELDGPRNIFNLDPAFSSPVSASIKGTSLTCPTPYPSPPQAAMLGPSFLFHAVPEPSTFALLAVSVVGLLAWSWRGK
jgi:hypothetical protein